MNATAADAAHEAAEQLGALARDLHDRGFTAHVTRVGDYECVSVANRAVSQLSENIRAAPADDGTWWFWWSWGDRIARVSDVATAAFKIAYVLTPHTNR